MNNKGKGPDETIEQIETVPTKNERNTKEQLLFIGDTYHEINEKERRIIENLVKIIDNEKLG